MNVDLNKCTSFLVSAGSHAYGFSTAESDYDYRGIGIAPMRCYIGLNDKFEHAVGKDIFKFYPVGLMKDDPRVEGADQDKTPDIQINELRKFVMLACQNNPSIIETLFTDESDWIRCDPIMQPLLDNRDLLLSKQVKSRFCGYAAQQLKRLKNHKKWLDNPPTHQPTREEFGLPGRTVIGADQLGAAEALIQKELDEFMISQDDLPEDTKIELMSSLGKMMRAVWYSINLDKKYPIDDDGGLTSTHEAMSIGIAINNGFSENFIELLLKEKKYKAALNHWRQYNTWLKQRNPKRAEMEKKFGFDCYSDDTEFLTNTGWKLFDDISEKDELATVFWDKAGLDMGHRAEIFGLEYQKYIDRFESSYTGPMYNLTGNHVDVLVTPNHRMLYRKVERKSEKSYSWELNEAATLPDTFEILRCLTPKKATFSNKDIFKDIPIKPFAFLSLMGWYLSDGSISFRNNKAKEVRISQKKGGRLCQSMRKFKNNYAEKASCSIYEYLRKPGGFRPNNEITEVILSVRNKDIVNKIVTDCGFTKTKRIPRWVFGLSKYLMNCLLDAMHRGDGTDSRPDNSKIYYSSLKGLADDVQELAMLCGYETSLYGPYGPYEGAEYDTEMYQVHYNKTRTQFKKVTRNRVINKVDVKNKRIVCFTVPNRTLITRRNGHIGFHGNSKHAVHLVRLIRMAKEILETGKVHVKRPDAEELLAIRNGAWSYEQIVEFAEREDHNLIEVSKNSKLPNKVNVNLFDKIVQEMIVKYQEVHND